MNYFNYLLMNEIEKKSLEDKFTTFLLVEDYCNESKRWITCPQIFEKSNEFILKTLNSTIKEYESITIHTISQTFSFYPSKEKIEFALANKEFFPKGIQKP